MWTTPDPSSRCPDTRQSPDPPSPARMLVLLLLLPWAWGALAASPPVSPGSVTLRLLHAATFHSASSMDMQREMALLGDFRTHSLNCSTCRIRFLQPRAQRGLTPKEWQDLEAVIHCSLSDFTRLVHKVVKQEELGYPFVIQASIGCQLHPNGTSRGFCDAAVNGDHVRSFNVDAGIRVPRLQRKVLLYVQDLLSRDRGTTIMLQLLLRTACVNEIKSFSQRGKESLQRQEHPVAVVFAREPPPAKTPELLLLVCRVTGFYPWPVRMAWLQNGEEMVPGWWLNSTGILPNADLTYQLRSSLAVEPGDGHSYTCWVDHSSLGGQSLLIPW
ncbi:antigen-presenting glycoprotein CD1d-like, partial [Emydura macquarii macquarii]|uniref:antigen-presenting glycoprotein CD1d-like n=1 Tax=Emydura macquarii macquarii TaxID=1129001 RepID=UPI00352A04DB